MIVDTSKMTMAQKTELMQQLANEVILESKSEEFLNKSNENMRIAGMLRVFGDQFSSSIELMYKWTKTAT